MLRNPCPSDPEFVSDSPNTSGIRVSKRHWGLFVHCFCALYIKISMLICIVIRTTGEIDENQTFDCCNRA